MSINLDRLEDTLSNIGYKYQFVNGGWSANITQNSFYLAKPFIPLPQYVVLLMVLMISGY